MTAILWLVWLLGAAQDERQPPRFREAVDVRRLLVDVRVIDAGRPVLGLNADDFAVRIDGKPARVDSLQWVGGMPESTSQATGEAHHVVERAAGGRLVVFVVQKDLESSRMTGLMRAMTEMPDFLTSFTPEDRAAVLSFDTRLRVWLDFTNYFERVRSVLQRGVIVERPGTINQSAGPSLLDRLPPSRASRTWTIEDALAVLGDALAPLSGPKTVVLLGYGFGRLTGGRNPAGWSVMMEPAYDRARAALQAARASVFCLDITTADYHSLEAGLQTVAAHTGGFFVRTHIFTKQAFDRLSAALAGHYVLFVEKPTLRSGAHRIEVKLTTRRGSIFARSGYVEP